MLSEALGEEGDACGSRLICTGPGRSRPCAVGDPTGGAFAPLVRRLCARVGPDEDDDDDDEDDDDDRDDGAAGGERPGPEPSRPIAAGEPWPEAGWALADWVRALSAWLRAVAGEAC